MENAPKPHIGDGEMVESSASVAEFPHEPFQCPACGQLLAPSCRVCVACRKPIDFGAVGRAPVVESVPAAPPAAEASPPRERVPYPWRLLLIVVGIGLILGLISVAVWGDQKGPQIIQGMPILAGIWVFFDAIRRRIPRPLRWGLGTMLLLAVVLPWYLARRSKPEATVPFVEAEVGPVTRFLLFALLIFFLIGLVINMVQNPPPKVQPAPKLQPGGNGSRVTFRLPLHFPHTRRRGRYVALGAADTNAPSEARHT